MSIDIQFKTILFSLIYGFVFSFVIGLNYKYICGKGLLSFILSFMLVFVFSLMFFIGLKYINYGVFHYHEVLSIIIGFLLENLVYRVVEKKLKKWYTFISKVGE